MFVTLERLFLPICFGFRIIRKTRVSDGKEKMT